MRRERLILLAKEKKAFSSKSYGEEIWDKKYSIEYGKKEESVKINGNSTSKLFLGNTHIKKPKFEREKHHDIYIYMNTYEWNSSGIEKNDY